MNGYKKASHPVQPENRRWAIARLQERFVQLGRIPLKADFEEFERMQIKTFLGPWPRALEEAGLKERKQKDKGGN